MESVDEEKRTYIRNMMKNIMNFIEALKSGKPKGIIKNLKQIFYIIPLPEGKICLQNKIFNFFKIKFNKNKYLLKNKFQEATGHIPLRGNSL